MIYGDSTLTGRTLIWDFVQYEIGTRPLLGWGYQSFWLVGSDAPSVVEAPGWIKSMPNAHNGYYDATVELGYIGYVLLLAFILTCLHAIGRIAEREPARAWIVLSLALYIICFNYLESLWFRGFEFLWIVFLILAAEIGRYWQPVRELNSDPGSGRRSRGRNLSRDAQGTGPRYFRDAISEERIVWVRQAVLILATLTGFQICQMRKHSGATFRTVRIHVVGAPRATPSFA
jgi:O-antigen ligase